MFIQEHNSHGDLWNFITFTYYGKLMLFLVKLVKFQWEDKILQGGGAYG